MSMPKIVAPKKLIEVALPLDEINKAAAKEKSIRHGHPATLHLWWARRPLAAARAILFAQLVNDPGWKYDEDELKKPQVRSAITRKRNELFRLIAELVQWENTNNQDVLARARAEITTSWKETCEANRSHPDAAVLFDPKTPPAAHDPFAGGGTIPLEAQRLGLVAHATDLNPVAVLINKAMIEVAPKFAGRPPVNPAARSEKRLLAQSWSGAQGLADDVRYYGQWMRDEAAKRIGHLYPEMTVTAEVAKGRPDLKPLVGQSITVVAWLWARTVHSPNPAFGQIAVPLASTFTLSKKDGQEFHVVPVVERSTYRFAVKTGTPADADATEGGTKMGRGATFRCVLSGAPITPEYIRAEAKAGRMGARLMAVVAESGRGRTYLPPSEQMEQAARGAQPVWKPDVEFFQQALGFRVEAIFEKRGFAIVRSAA